MTEVLTTILKHMLEPITYFPWGLLAGAMFLVAIKVWQRIARQKVQGLNRRHWIHFLCIVYATVLLILTYFSREPGSRVGITIEIFRTWGNSAMEHAFFIENIILFIPFGILFPMGFPPLRKARFCILEGFLFSVFLELIQFTTARGYSQLDDIVTNTLGAGIGWCIYKIGHRIRQTSTT